MKPPIAGAELENSGKKKPSIHKMTTTVNQHIFLPQEHIFVRFVVRFDLYIRTCDFISLIACV